MHFAEKYLEIAEKYSEIAFTEINEVYWLIATINIIGGGREVVISLMQIPRFFWTNYMLLEILYFVLPTSKKRECMHFAVKCAFFSVNIYNTPTKRQT